MKDFIHFPHCKPNHREPLAPCTKTTFMSASTSASVHSPNQLNDEDVLHDEDEIVNEDEEDEESQNSDALREPTALSEAALAKYRAEREKAGIIYISRIPPGMSPTKVRHLMGAYGQIGKLYLQAEGTFQPSFRFSLLISSNIYVIPSPDTDPKRTYLRKKFTTSKKRHYTEGWVEFKDKKVARSVADMLNAQPIGGKKGSRWRDDVWTMKYLPKFKWYMLTEQIGQFILLSHVLFSLTLSMAAHEQATHAARLRVELNQSKMEQKHYLKQVEIAKSLDKRNEKKRKRAEAEGREPSEDAPIPPKQKTKEADDSSRTKKRRTEEEQAHKARHIPDASLDTVLGQVF